MATYRVGLIGRETGNVFVYNVATIAPNPTDVEVFEAALAEHGKNLLLERVTETVLADRAEVELIE